MGHAQETISGATANGDAIPLNGAFLQQFTPPDFVLDFVPLGLRPEKADALGSESFGGVVPGEFILPPS